MMDYIQDERAISLVYDAAALNALATRKQTRWLNHDV